MAAPFGKGEWELQVLGSVGGGVGFQGAAEKEKRVAITLTACQSNIARESKNEAKKNQLCFHIPSAVWLRAKPRTPVLSFAVLQTGIAFSLYWSTSSAKGA